jgi:hypothetical protein
MAKKTDRLEIRISPQIKNRLQEDALNLGFGQGQGMPNFSRYCRWILRNGNKPIDRSQYEELIKINHNLIKLGGLTNQYLYHLNRERKILLDKGIEDNNKKYLENLDRQNERLDEIKSLLLDLKKATREISILENA